MSEGKRRRNLDRARRERAQRASRSTRSGKPPARRSRFQRAECCGAMVAADPGRMGRDWADVHEDGCTAPWEALGLDGEPRPVFPGAPWLPAGLQLRAVNRKAGSAPASPQHAARRLESR